MREQRLQETPRKMRLIGIRHGSIVNAHAFHGSEMSRQVRTSSSAAHLKLPATNSRPGNVTSTAVRPGQTISIHSMFLATSRGLSGSAAGRTRTPPEGLAGVVSQHIKSKDWVTTPAPALSGRFRSTGPPPSALVKTRSSPADKGDWRMEGACSGIIPPVWSDTILR